MSQVLSNIKFKARRFFVTGGAGFIGATMCQKLLEQNSVEAVTVIDNFSSGREWHIEKFRSDPRFTLIRGELHNAELLVSSMKTHDCVIHFASNPDIAKAVTDPDIDYRQGTELTRAVVEAARINRVENILYTSGSGVYGDMGEALMTEESGKFEPVSTYAASKIAGEALISAYAHMHGLEARAFRFANVVGPHQTHGVGYDFLKKLLRDSSRLRILGDGNQSKSYIYVDDVVEAMLLALNVSKGPYQVYNVGTGDYVTVNEIAQIAVEVLGLQGGSVRFEYTGGSVGWRGDVAKMRMDSTKISTLGWKRSRGSRQAILDSLRGMLDNAKKGLFQ